MRARLRVGTRRGPTVLWQSVYHRGGLLQGVPPPPPANDDPGAAPGPSTVFSAAGAAARVDLKQGSRVGRFRGLTESDSDAECFTSPARH